MINPPISELMKKVDSRYTLCVVVGKRARQLLDGAYSLAKCDSEKPVAIAANEVNEGKLIYVRTKSGLK
ncbi:DNA-directed RNA polymerase subunit omega [Anaerobacterium chartisolvens]|uniref:DNA-directed RNA polymerase subunit omega n=1 Tax=Anaerobacterium chartisolvens TaxID=1297424 RepID=A0A369BD20_9FIRM|nr:DNA-directed RNA polymerase subunit omega [Anaerobacterium chartisolvens]RCX19462.1 DNA-directed RNA polymerase subunit omega [Anaerobacterium chartisolvens]